MPVKSASRPAKSTDKKIGPVGTALGLEPQDVLKTLVGSIKKIWPSKEFKGPHGPFTIQNVELFVQSVDGIPREEVEVRVSIFDEELPDDWVNEIIQFASVKQKGVLGGVSYETNTGKNKEGDTVLYENFKVTKTAIIELVGNEGAGEESEEDRGRKEDGAKQEAANHELERQKQSAPASTPPKETHTVLDKDVRGSQLSSDQVVMACFKVHAMVRGLVLKHYPEVNQPELIAATTTTIFITAKDKGAVDKMLSEMRGEVPKSAANAGLGQTPAAKQEPPQEATDWRKAIIPSGTYKGNELGTLSDLDLYNLYKFVLQKEETTNRPPTEFGKMVIVGTESRNLHLAPPADTDEDQLP